MKRFENLRKAELENEWWKISHDVADQEIFAIVQRLDSPILEICDVTDLTPSYLGVWPFVEKWQLTEPYNSNT